MSVNWYNNGIVLSIFYPFMLFITSQIPPDEPFLTKQAVMDGKFLICFSVLTTVFFGP